ncbi:uncharacterized protein K452DRAFT_297836 [Aplosporella prunicola CBS 121167]|uniref:NADPH-dependent FMN reductase-like domain-containing protein n=1 Tax=Aplosporella prunicola CBS 121167 TaxID=1176127 RepID=A0A6A6BET4_9PEZI|nr:uncharacterized protein K452DRAFT_297836 [Aplosporella prunicola CBS 121167]KAF2142576.1 hypothetical protein K452DRAFT_297836 [Aplosporella prunicola CBS 121167]
MPATKTIALDYLFHEWGGKPAAVVSYGSRGGGKAADHLSGITAGLRMRGVQTSVGIRTGGLEAGECADRGELGEEVLVRWREEGVEEQLKTMLAEVVKALEEQ